MDLSPTLAFRALIGLLLTLSAYFIVDVELRRAAMRGDADGDALPSGTSVTLTTVVDGDELLVTAGSRAFTVRLIGIQAFDTLDEPGLGDPGARATDALRAWEGQTASLVFPTWATDRAGRVLAYVELPCAPDAPDSCVPTDLGADQLTKGWVAAYTKYPFDRVDTYLQIEAGARSEGRGLWAYPLAAARVDQLRAAREAAP